MANVLYMETLIFFESCKPQKDEPEANFSLMQN